MGLRFPNPVGLAAGLDKNARYLQPLADFGFGWLELGTVTPRPQAGNPKKRLFRLPAQEALINRMGFNNAGVTAFVQNLKAQNKPGLLGINIGKNRDTPMDKAVDDYIMALRGVYSHADYVAVNISSPNTPQLLELQEGNKLQELLSALKAEQAQLHEKTGKYVPVALKIAPDLDSAEIETIASLVLEYHFDAVIATNTTVSRRDLEAVPEAAMAGGLSGRPLKDLSTAVIRQLYAKLRGQVPIIGVGGIGNAADAWEKLAAGADLIQLYTALIYSGPGIVKSIVAGLGEYIRAQGATDLSQALTNARKNILSPQPDTTKMHKQFP
jgi:dihydroorotate dehydrogenase